MNVIERLLSQAHYADLPDLDAHGKLLRRAHSTLVAAEQNAAPSFLGVEQYAAEQNKRAHAAAQSGYDELVGAQERLERLDRIASTYKCVNIELLKWRTSDGMPMLVPFTFRSGRLTFSAYTNYGRVSSDIEPNTYVNNTYRDVCRVLEKEYKRRELYRSELTLRYVFAGTLSQGVRSTIDKVKGEFEQGVYILGVPTSHTLAVGHCSRSNAISGSVVVVGYDRGLDPNKVWIVSTPRDRTT